MRHIIFTMIFMCIINTINSQNLIPNHSFEKVNFVDSMFSSSHYGFNAEISQWTSPTQSSPDVIHEPYIETMHAGRKIRGNFFIKPLKPKTGKRFVGIKVYGCVPANTHCREYLQIETLKKLEIGQCYLYSYYTNPLTNGSRINNMGVAFSEEKVDRIEVEGVLDLGNRFGVEEIVKPGPGKWQEISGVVKATEAWNFMIIGNFFHDRETLEIANKGGYKYGYYLVDEVSLVHADCVTKRPIVKNISKFIYFESNKSKLEEINKNKLLAIFNEIKESAYKSIKIYGHADEDGTEQFNQKLSIQRANAVKQYFINLGVPIDKITLAGYGEQSPVSQDDKGQNRRVEIQFTINN